MEKKKLKKIIWFSAGVLVFGFWFSLLLNAEDLQESVEYTAFEQKDPFLSCLPEEHKEVPQGQISQTQPQAEVKLPEMALQGIVWQTNSPQAIIDGQVVKVGDTIKEAKVIKIAKEGISFLYQEKLFTINSPNVEILQSTTSKSIEGGAK